MSDPYEEQPVSPEALKQELNEVHGGPPSEEAVQEVLEELREKQNDFSNDNSDGADDTGRAGDRIHSPEAHWNMIGALRETDECPVCDAPTPKGGLPAHIVEKHSE